MTDSDDQTPTGDRLARAYDRMMEHVRSALDTAEQNTRPKLSHLLENAKDKAIELGEVTQEEAERVASYLQRDIEDAANYLTGNTAEDLVSWFKFDIELIEERLLELFTSVADPTKVELMLLEEQARRTEQYHTGEITGIGTLHCAECGKAIHFHSTAHIPPCPKCHATRFTR